MGTWKKGWKQTTAVFLTTVLLGSTVDLTAFAEVGDEITSYTQCTDSEADTQTVTQTIIPTVELPSSEELFAGYVDKAFYGGISLYGVSARAELDTLGQSLYDYLKTNIEGVAAGTIETTKFTVDVETLTSWNATRTFNTTETNEAFAAFLEQFEVSKVIDALLHDCPYDLYWFDKTEGVSETGSLSKGSTSCTIYSVNFIFKVAENYQADNYNQSAPAVNTVKTAATSTAVTNAKAVVAANEDKSDYEKLSAYRDYICEAVSYNTEAASSTYTGGYGDPWQLIYVFDNDSSTNVVCEGYSKAFQYLCDLTTFCDDVYCYTITGVMSGSSGSGGHMWNIVTMKDNKNYLVDVTNSDTGSVGAKGGLFLAGTTGSVDSGYNFTTASGQSVAYAYDTDIISLWGSSVLTLAESDYEPVSTYEVSFLGSNMTSSGGTTAVSDSDYTAVLTADKGYLLPENITVTVENTALNGGSDYVYSQSDGSLTIYQSAITSNIAITGAAVQNLTFVDDKVSVDVSDITYGEIPKPQGSLEGSGTGTWTYTYSKDGVSFVELSELQKDSGYLEQGDYMVKATYEDDTQLGSKTAAFKVNKKVLEVIVDAALVTKTYDGNTSVSVEPVLSLSGAVASETPSLDTSAIAYVYENQNAGENKSIMVSGIALSSDTVNDNYSVSTTATGTGASITKAALLVTADSQTKIYGAADPVLTYTANGLVNGEQLSGELTRSAGESVGTYAILQGTLTEEENLNYNITFQGADFTINKATPYVATAPLATAISYGDTLSASTLTNGMVQYGNGSGAAGSTESVSGSFAWKDGTSKPVAADSNTTEYMVVFTPEDTTNYNTVEIPVTLTVEKAAVTPNMPETTMNVTNSCYKVGDVSLPEGWVWQTADTTLEVGVPVSATAVYDGEDKGNYETELVTITITRAACEHEPGEILYTQEGEQEPDCENTGLGHRECIKCHDIIEEGIVVEAFGHAGGSATCIKKAVCDTCHEEYGQLDMTNHGETEIKDNKVVTCKESGYTGDSYCKDCGAKTASGEIIEKLTTHTWDEGAITKEATCTKTGEITYTCTVCTTTKTEEIEKTTHSLAKIEKVEASCTQEGMQEYWKCSECEKKFSDAQGNYEITDTHTLVIPATGHTGGTATCAKKAVCEVCQKEYGELDETNHKDTEIRNPKEATCKEAGYTGDTYCKDCGEKIAFGEIIEKLTAHTWDEGVITKEATCTETGEITYTCTVCTTTKTEEIEKTTHSLAKIEKVEASCTQEGMQEYWKCSECEKKFSDAQGNYELTDTHTLVIPATGHTGGTATCAKKAVCEECQKEYGELDETNHKDTEIRNQKEATCKEAGYTGDTYCKDCGEKIASGEAIKKLTTHTWDNGQVTKEPTTTQKGIKTYTCTFCTTTKTEEIAALGAPEKNTILTDETNQASYKVLISGTENGAVEYVGPVDKNVKTVIIPTTITIEGVNYQVTGIAKNAFKNCKKLTKVTMGGNIKTIGENAFYGCTKLKTVTIGKNVTVIQNKAFYKCTALTKVTIPAKVTKIGKQAFYGCKKLKTITIKTKKLTTKTVGSKSFGGIYKKAVIKVPKAKLKAYKSMLKKKGVGKQAKVKK